MTVASGLARLDELPLTFQHWMIATANWSDCTESIAHGLPPRATPLRLMVLKQSFRRSTFNAISKEWTAFCSLLRRLTANTWKKKKRQPSVQDSLWNGFHALQF